jgi:hypothetical protein
MTATLIALMIAAKLSDAITTVSAMVCGGIPMMAADTAKHAQIANQSAMTASAPDETLEKHRRRHNWSPQADRRLGKPCSQLSLTR